MKSCLKKLFEQEHLTTEEIKHAMDYCLSEQVTDTEIAAFLTALRMKGETAEEIAGIVDVIRDQSEMSTIQLPNAMDNCGTGGDQSYSFNISTTSAFVLAGAGIPIAKHGNRSISSKAGSADVLEYLGVSLTLSKEDTKKMLTENNISFLFAPHVHANLRPFMKVRKELVLPTIFNLIGPLTNPIELETQVMGVYRKDKLTTIAESLLRLGRKRAVVMHGAGNMDEASLAGENYLVLLDNDNISSFTLAPEDVGLPTYSNDMIRGGDTAKNAEILLSVLNNEPGPYLDTVLLNAGIGIYANGKVNSIIDGIQIARETIASGAALERLHTLIHFSKSRTKEVIQ